MQAGAGKATIQLEGVLPFDGFESQASDLHVRALVVEAAAASGSDETPEEDNPASTHRCCILSVEATSLKPEVVGLLRTTAADAAGCDPVGVWVTVTHTFSAPHVRTASHLANDRERGRNELLLKALRDAARESAGKARATLTPARMAWATARADVNVNRDVETPEGWWLGRDPAGYADHEVPVLWLLPAAGDPAPLAALFSADVQSSVLHGSDDPSLRHIVSGDLAGAAMDAIESALPGCIALYLTGSAGDQAPATDSLDGLASVLAASVTDSLPQAAPLNTSGIVASEQTLDLPGQERADFATLAPTRTYRYVPSSPVSSTVSLLRLGPVALVGVLPELDSDLGSQVRSLAPHVLLATLVNGGQKYLPGPASYDRIAYEAMNSAFAKGADAVLLGTIQHALQDPAQRSIA